MTELYENPKISIGAKALYGYLCEIIGEDGHSDFTVKEISNRLGISEITFAKYRGELVRCGYLTTKRISFGASGKPANKYILRKN